MEPLDIQLPPYSKKRPNEFVDNSPSTDLVVYLDGSCDPNPGGLMYMGILITYKGKKIYDESAFCGDNGTNNQAELHAFIRSAQVLRMVFTKYTDYKVPATFVSDSRIVVDAVRDIRPFRSDLLIDLVTRFQQHYSLLNPRPKILWVKRKFNVAADKLSKQSRNQRKSDTDGQESSEPEA